MIAVAQALPAVALYCAKASQPIEKMLCSAPELKKTDDEMSAAYFKLLRETRDPDFHVALIRGQQRWLKARLTISVEDELERHERLLKTTQRRLDALSKGEPVRQMENQRKLRSKESGGPFAGYLTSCDFWPPDYAHGSDG